MFWTKHLDLEYCSTCLNNLHPAIKYMSEKAKLIQSDHSQPYQILNFLDIQSNRDPDRYRANFIIIDNNDKTSSSRTIEDDSCKLGDGSLSHMFCCKSKI